MSLAHRRAFFLVVSCVERLFQCGLKGNQPETWFMKAPLGHTVLGDMLPRINEAARLSRRYTNHCLRATSVGILKGFRLRRPSCMPPDRAQNPAKPRKLLQVIRKREASSRTCVRRKNVQVVRRRGFFLFF